VKFAARHQDLLKALSVLVLPKLAAQVQVAAQAVMMVVALLSPAAEVAAEQEAVACYLPGLK
jgi:hypothetical protein